MADVLLLLNLAERGEGTIGDRDLRLQRTNRNYLPPCIAEDRSPLKPNRPLGMAGDSAPGSSCTAECQFGLCPYPSKGAQPHRQELSEAFCRRQQRLLSPGTLRSRAAPWQEISSSGGSGGSGESSVNRCRAENSNATAPAKPARQSPSVGVPAFTLEARS